MGQGDDLTLVYVVKPGEQNERLRYSLRSIAAHLPCAHVVIVGHKPGWVTGVEHVYVPQSHRHRSNVPRMIHRFVEAKVADEWVLMNDDFFCMSEGADIPLVYNGTLDELACKGSWRFGFYGQALSHTRKLLVERGQDEALSYDRVHRPMPVKTAVMREVLDASLGYPVLHRSLYGNTVDDGVPGTDAKLRQYASTPPPSGWMSTSRESWQGLAGGVVRSRFDTKCRFET